MNSRILYNSMLALAVSAGMCFAVEGGNSKQDAKLENQAKITKAEARKTALRKVPDGTIKEGELEKEHGKLIWSFDISRPNSRNITEVQVDALTGKIATVTIETPKDQAKEARETAHEK